MSQFTSKGKLIGYRNYQDKAKKTVHVYSVLIGDVNELGLYDGDVELAQVFQDDFTLSSVEPQTVQFDLSVSRFGGSVSIKYKNVREIDAE